MQIDRYVRCTWTRKLIHKLEKGYYNENVWTSHSVMAGVAKVQAKPCCSQMPQKRAPRKLEVSTWGRCLSSYGAAPYNH